MEQGWIEVVKWTRVLAGRRVSRPKDGHASGDHGDHFTGYSLEIGSSVFPKNLHFRANQDYHPFTPPHEIFEDTRGNTGCSLCTKADI